MKSKNILWIKRFIKVCVIVTVVFLALFLILILVLIFLHRPRNRQSFPLSVTGDFYEGDVLAEVWNIPYAPDGELAVRILQENGHPISDTFYIGALRWIGEIEIPFSPNQYFLEYDAEKNGFYFLYVPAGDFVDGLNRDFWRVGILEYIDLNKKKVDKTEGIQLAYRWYLEIIEPFQYAKREEAYEAGEIGEYNSVKTKSSSFETKWHWNENHDREMYMYARYHFAGNFYQTDLNGDGFGELLVEDLDVKGKRIARVYDYVQRTLKVEPVGRIYLDGDMGELVLNYYWDNYKREGFYANLVTEPAEMPGEYYLREYHYTVQKKWKELVLDTKEVSCELIIGGEDALQEAKEKVNGRLENWYQWIGTCTLQSTSVEELEERLHAKKEGSKEKEGEKNVDIGISQ